MSPAKSLLGTSKNSKSDLIYGRKILKLLTLAFCKNQFLEVPFCPSLKLKTKRRDGAKYRKTYHPPQTPYQRLLDHPEVPESTKTALRHQHQALNPFELKAKIEQQLKRIFSIISVTPNVRHRL